MLIRDRYVAQPHKVASGLHVDIYDTAQKEIVGSYERNFDSLLDTFHPFVHKGKTYALYSKDYTATRVMSLPDCTDIGGQVGDNMGFCPMEFYVPIAEDFPDTSVLEYPFGFIGGCIWGDDTSLKVQFVDFKALEQGVVVIDDRLGYLEVPRTVPTLREAISRLSYDSGSKESSVVFVQEEKKVIYDAEGTDKNESKLENTFLLFDCIVDCNTTKRYVIPQLFFTSDEHGTFLRDLWDAIHAYTSPKRVKPSLYRYDKGVEKPTLDEEELRFIAEVRLVTGLRKPVSEYEELYYKSWVEYEVKSVRLGKSFNWLYTLDVG